MGMAHELEACVLFKENIKESGVEFLAENLHKVAANSDCSSENYENLALYSRRERY